MAVHTQIDEAALRQFLTAYNLGALQGFHGIAEGVENSNFLLAAGASRYILTLFEQRTEESALPFYMALMQFLNAAGLACPQPVARRDGGFLGRLMGRPAAIVSFLPGKAVEQPQVAHCAELGAGLARLHLAGQGFPQARANSMGPQSWPAIWAKCAPHCPDFAAEFAEAGAGPALRAEIEAELAALAAIWPQNLPQGIIHADLFPDNVFFHGDKLSGLIDFYFACTDSLAYDVAICLNAWCFDAAAVYEPAKGRALLAAYQQIRPLAAAERAALPLLARGAALRFFLTRLHDWFFTPPQSAVVKKPPLAYLRRLRFFRALSKNGELPE